MASVAITVNPGCSGFALGLLEAFLAGAGAASDMMAVSWISL